MNQADAIEILTEGQPAPTAERRNGIPKGLNLLIEVQADREGLYIMSLDGILLAGDFSRSVNLMPRQQVIQMARWGWTVDDDEVCWMHYTGEDA